ncbi:cation:proton antiporter domain-containing protein [Cyclobacterium marinum]|uniref:Sodium/hydrogen exchanger n=1 Tax=Cyclobacterium marinum (strain ATCC 25205 / DSM 745 / LMG 13164 / NCIMB 1802) TaxID=880070 RepID=G0IYB8_CYCMS|nr:cation:proton antiporter [Cyclobacterium marinum]AEL25653.1 sodium/hydrogen exchanger [Cyclobacterium marinum DSM 745]MBI0401083.1 cation:proton antiporter [Cyclobacterium marinum]|tara:strand:+ start:391 stop:1617 length:1227 start_codon:yes stop_codon:yes gene_type:complete
MTLPIIIVLCALMLFAYFFDITSARTKIPPVILLFAMGWAANQAASFLDLDIPDLTTVLPFLGTIGLVLIVLEGALELDFDTSKLSFVGKTVLIAIIPVIVISLSLAYAIQFFADVAFKSALLNAIPFAIISSAIAIPSVQNLRAVNREFVTYESSVSDIFGVLLFNFLLEKKIMNAKTLGLFFGEIVMILIVTFFATIMLAFLLSRIKHPVKFAPIILMIVLIFAVSELYHLPALIFILLFGLFIGNLNQLKQSVFVKKLHTKSFKKEIKKFKELTMELTFLIRTLFFLVFGFLIETNELINTETLIWSVSITAGIFLLRALILKIFKINLLPLMFISPRGLVTILLYLSVPLTMSIPIINDSLIIQVIIFTSLAMMLGMLTSKPKKDKEESKSNEAGPQNQSLSNG